MLERWNTEELQELDPLETALEAADGDTGGPVPVRLHSRITEVGTLELSFQCTRDPRHWKLEFNVREGVD
jgi:HAMP domain-containing protein